MILPPGFVNLIELVNKFLSIVFVKEGSAKTNFSASKFFSISICLLKAIPEIRGIVASIIEFIDVMIKSHCNSPV